MSEILQPLNPRIVRARSPLDADKEIALYCTQKTMDLFLDGRVNSKLGEFLGLVHGALAFPLGCMTREPSAEA